MEMIFQVIQVTSSYSSNFGLFTQSYCNIYYSELQFVDFIYIFLILQNGFFIVSYLITVFICLNARFRWLDCEGVLQIDNKVYSNKQCDVTTHNGG